jgi:hypothetical protein
MYQHRSLALAMPRTSTAVFNSRHAKWMVMNTKEQSIGKVYSSSVNDIPAGKYLVSDDEISIERW